MFSDLVGLFASLSGRYQVGSSSHLIGNILDATPSPQIISKVHDPPIDVCAILGDFRYHISRQYGQRTYRPRNS